jgi:hypothetical protein
MYREFICQSLSAPNDESSVAVLARVPGSAVNRMPNAVLWREDLAETASHTRAALRMRQQHAM